MNTGVTHLPTNLDIDQLKSEYPPPFKVNRDKFVYIASRILNVRATDPKQQKNAGYWVRLHSKMFEYAGIRDFPLYRDWLLDAGVIEVDWQYIVGERARAYRFTEKYRTPPKVEMIQNATLRHKFTKPSPQQIWSMNNYPYLSGTLNDMEINSKLAKEYTEYLYHQEEKCNNEKAQVKRDINLITIDHIDNGQYFFSQDTTAGRIHSNVTLIRSPLRNCLTLEGAQIRY